LSLLSKFYIVLHSTGQTIFVPFSSWMIKAAVATVESAAAITGHFAG